MKIGILSGKGGTGKTTVAVNLAEVLNSNFMDCDVEEPNGAIFLKPKGLNQEVVTMLVPKINVQRCVLCGNCVKYCNFNAMVKVESQVLIFEEMCSGCGACSMVCNHGAISNYRRRIGEIVYGLTNVGSFTSGMLDIGESTGNRIIKEMFKKRTLDELTVVDCAPGVSENVVAVLQEVDYGIVVTEPTLFGLSDLEKTVKFLNKLEISFGVIINRSNKQDSMINEYCEEYGIKIIGRIPYDKKIAIKYSKGELIVDRYEYRRLFEKLGKLILDELS